MIPAATTTLFGCKRAENGLLVTPRFPCYRPSRLWYSVPPVAGALGPRALSAWPRRLPQPRLDEMRKILDLDQGSSCGLHSTTSGMAMPQSCVRRILASPAHLRLDRSPTRIH